VDSENRIQTTSVVPSLPRQTPKNDFGDVLANTMSKATVAGGALINGMGMAFGAPVLSAAVSNVTALAATAAGPSGVLPVGSRTPASVASVAGAPARDDMWGLLHLQDMQSREFLALQNEMQRESREFNAISNVIKVRHDSAKAAINNIR
jgi:hypothetical protein